eukprot:Awhi_evm1s9250
MFQKVEAKIIIMSNSVTVKIKRGTLAMDLTAMSPVNILSEDQEFRQELWVKLKVIHPENDGILALAKI